MKYVIKKLYNKRFDNIRYYVFYKDGYNNIYDTMHQFKTRKEANQFIEYDMKKFNGIKIT